MASVRLLCRAHNQFAAEQTYGADFMRGKREQGKAACGRGEGEARGERRLQKAAAAAAKARAEEIIPWLQELGCTLQRARRGVELTAHMLDAPIEERMKAALRGLAPRCTIIKPNGERVPG